jgi:hypothetical protein
LSREEIILSDIVSIQSAQKKGEIGREEEKEKAAVAYAGGCS